MKNIKLEMLPDSEVSLIKDLTLLLLKKGIITCEELNDCQGKSSDLPFSEPALVESWTSSNMSGKIIPYLNAKEEEEGDQ
jgi:hypothetical protein